MYPHIPLIFLPAPRRSHHTHMHLHLIASFILRHIVNRDHDDDVPNHLHHILHPHFSSLLHQHPNHFHLYPPMPLRSIHLHPHHLVLVLDCLHIATNHHIILLDYLNPASVAPISS